MANTTAKGLQHEAATLMKTGFSSLASRPSWLRRTACANSAEPEQDPRSFPLPGISCLGKPGA